MDIRRLNGGGFWGYSS